MERTKKQLKIRAFTLVETIIAMTLISIIFLMIMQAFNSILLSSYLIDARTAVRNESEFVSEYFELRIKNADPRSINLNPDYELDCTDTFIRWTNTGSSTRYVFLYDTSKDQHTGKKNARFCLNTGNNTTSCENVLTYSDVIVDNVNITCEEVTVEATREEFRLINLNYDMSSTQQLGDRAAVQSVPRHISISIR